MKLSFRNTKAEALSGDGVVWDYPVPDEQIGFARQKLNGRVPEKGFYVNKVCHELVYILQGSGTLILESKKIKFEPGDLLVIPPGKKSAIIAHHVILLTITRPNFYADQCALIP